VTTPTAPRQPRPGAPLAPHCAEQLRGLVASTATAELCPSIAWGVLVDGALVDGEGTDTVYRIASMTKSFTAATVLALRDQGAWRLDDPVAWHAPELATVRGPRGSAAVTLAHLLSMSSGLATDDPWADRHLHIATAEIDAIYAAGPTFAARPGDAFEYSNLGYAMLGRAVLRATGRHVRDLVDEWFLRPLGMHDTTWTEPAHDRWARPHRVEDGRIVADPDTPLGDGELAPMGGLWSTVADLARWVAWLDADLDVPAGGPAGSPAFRREMQRMHTYQGRVEVASLLAPSGYGYGLGLRDDDRLGAVAGHSGGLPGYGSNMRWVRGRGVGAIALANTTYAPMSVLTLRMLHLLADHDVVPAPRAPAAPQLQAAATALVALCNDWSDDAAAALFADNVDPDESLARRAAALARLRATHGTLLIEQVHAERATSGVVTVRGEASEATLQIEVQLSPEPTPRVQWYEISG
jgi:CubicO group peptidase (beta-lactamase class C family)